MRIILKPAGLIVLAIAFVTLIIAFILERQHASDSERVLQEVSGSAPAPTPTAASSAAATPTTTAPATATTTTAAAAAPAASAAPAPVPGDMLSPTADKTPVYWRYSTQLPGPDWARQGFDDSHWTVGTAGFGHDQTAPIHTQWTASDIWMRREFNVPAKLHTAPAIRIFHDEDAEVYVNGVLAAPAPGYSSSYVAIPMTKAAFATLKPGGKNVIAVHCHNAVGGQFIDAGL